MIKIYHNNRCSKSRCTLDILKDKKLDTEIVDYLNNPPTASELKDILQMLGMNPIELIRKGEADFKENFKGKNLSDNEWIKAMIQYPKLIERPIVINNGKAVIGRPPEKVNEIL
ncbi:MAG: arsenate reductase (glutaredoxin) [Cyclobacteriaceae bacterium]